MSETDANDADSILPEDFLVEGYKPIYPRNVIVGIVFYEAVPSERDKAIKRFGRSNDVGNGFG